MIVSTEDFHYPFHQDISTNIYELYNEEPSMKEPKGPGIQYTITNKKVFFSISITTGNTSRALGISITSTMFTFLTL